MSKLAKIMLLFMPLVSWVVASAQATTYTFQSNDHQGNMADMMDIDHNIIMVGHL